MENIF